eukprot:scaffold23.g4125.t1
MPKRVALLLLAALGAAGAARGARAPRRGGATARSLAAEASPAPDPCWDWPANHWNCRSAAPLVRAAQGSVSGGTIGFRTGGQQDIENFRWGGLSGCSPETWVWCGVVWCGVVWCGVVWCGVVWCVAKDYYFDTSPSAPPERAAPAPAPGGDAPQPRVAAADDAAAPPPCTDLFCPRYSLALAPDPLLAAAGRAPPPDVFLAVGLDSGLQAADFKRKPLNLVLLLDASGSMASAGLNNQFCNLIGTPEQNATKFQVAKEVLTGIQGLLGPEDRFSIVLFGSSACVPKPLGLVRCADVAGIAAGIKGARAPGSTNMQDGYDTATAQLRACRECMTAGLNSSESRIVIITDAEPNTVIGVGLDFNTALIDTISRVTPLVFDLELKAILGKKESMGRVDSASLAGGWRLLAAYGSPNPNDTALGGNGTIMRVNTLFPSPKTEEGIKARTAISNGLPRPPPGLAPQGGVVLLRVAPPPAGADSQPLSLAVSYTDRANATFTSRRTVGIPAALLAAQQAGGGGGASEGPFLPPAEDSFFQSSGVRKAVALARYSDLMQTWRVWQFALALIDEWANFSGPVVVPADVCVLFPSAYCSDAVAQRQYDAVQAREGGASLTRVVRGCSRAEASGGCELGSWLNEDACILPVPVQVEWALSDWERQSRPLDASQESKAAIRAFIPYFEGELLALNDTSMVQEASAALRGGGEGRSGGGGDGPCAAVDVMEAVLAA